MKSFCILSAIALVGTCASPKYTTKIQNLKDSIEIVDSSHIITYANTITARDLSIHLFQFASKEFQGREAGGDGEKKAAQFIKSYYQKEGIPSPFGTSNYSQQVSAEFLSKNNSTSENLMAFIEGTTYPEEIVIISAHMDHLGISNNGAIYYGADDDGSGTVALMEMAQAFNQAKKEGHGPKRSIVFLHFTAEEIGKIGSEYYTSHPVFPLKNTLVDLNIDMIGRIDNLHKNNVNYIYLIGSDKLSKELHYISEKINNTFFKIDLDYRYNTEKEKNRYYTRSDHYNFASKEIPVIFYFNGEHEDYHQPTDTPDKINYNLLEKRTKLIFATAWQIANQDNRLVIDKKNDILN
jgi:hypothetical protein